MITVYDHGESVCCHKVRIALAEKGLDFERKNVALEAGEQISPEFLAVNPRGLVPVLVHNGRTMVDSTNILEYIDDAFPEPPLMPADPYWRYRRRWWARWIDEEMHVPHIATISFIIAFNTAFRSKLDTQEKLDAYLEHIPTAANRETLKISFESDLESDAFKASISAYDQFLDEMDRSLADNDYLAGPAFSLADIDVVPYIWRLHNLQLSGLWADRPRVQAWLDRVTERPSFREGVVEAVLPDWIELMKATGTQAWPTVNKLAQSVRAGGVVSA